MALGVAFDYYGNSWVPVYCNADDPVNLFGENAYSIADLPRHTNGAGGSVSVSGTDFTLFGDDRARYGKSYLNWTTGTVVTANVNIGYDAVTNWTISANVIPTGTYTAAFWAKRSTGNDNTFRLLVMRDSAVTVATGSSVTISNTAWQRFTLTFSFTASAGDDRLYVMLQRTNGDGTTQNVFVTGAMIVAGSEAPAFNFGADSLLGVLTEYVLDAKWDIGFKKPYQQVAPVNRAVITLSNIDRRFSPEYASSPLTGLLIPGRLVQIGDVDYGIKGTYWTEEWMPHPLTNKGQRATLTATDARRFCDDVLPTWGIQEPTITDQLDLVDTLLGQLDLPLGGASIEGTDFPIDFQAGGLQSHGYHPLFYGDDTVEGLDITGILADITLSAQGHFWWNRAGQWNLCESRITTNPVLASQDITDGDMIDASYGRDRLINSCDVTIFPKKQAASATIWTLDEDITLAAGETESFRITFRNTTGDKILVGADNLATSGFTLTSGTVPTHVTVTLSEARAQSALLTLVNISGISRTVNAGNVTGDRVLALRTLIKSYSDSTSITAYGTQNLTIASKWVGMRAWAKRLARWVVNRWKDPTYAFEWVRIDGDKSPQLAQDCYAGVSVYVTDTQTDHARVYGVVGEEHTARDGLSDYTLKLFLEPSCDDAIYNTTP